MNSIAGVHVWPIQQTLLSGEDIRIRCTYSDSEVVWTKQGKIISMFLEFLIIKNATEQDSGDYVCHGHWGESSNLQINATSTVLIAGDYAGSTNDIYKIYEGKNIEFTCDSTIPQKWYFERLDYYPYHHPVSTNSSSWVISEVQLKHGGYYYCYGSSDNGATHFLKRKELKVFLNKTSVMKVRQGSSAILYCNATPPVVWYKLKSKKVLSVSVYYKINEVTPYDQANYICKGTTKEGYTFRSMTALLVLIRADDKIYQNEKVVKVGRSIGFSCDSIISVRWLFNYRNTLPNNTIQTQGPTGYTLTIVDATRDNEGIYSCIGYDGTFFFHAKGTLQVFDRCPPLEFHNGKVVEMATFSGPVAEYTCDVDLKMFGNPKRECTKEGVWTGIEPVCMPKGASPISQAGMISSSLVNCLYYLMAVLHSVNCI